MTYLDPSPCDTNGCREANPTMVLTALQSESQVCRNVGCGRVDQNHRYLGVILGWNWEDLPLSVQHGIFKEFTGFLGKTIFGKWEGVKKLASTPRKFGSILKHHHKTSVNFYGFRDRPNQFLPSRPASWLRMTSCPNSRDRHRILEVLIVDRSCGASYLWLGKKVFFFIQKIGDYHSTWNLDKFGNSWWLPFSSSTIFLNCRWSSFYCHNPMMLGNFITSRFKWIGDYHPINWDFPPREDSPIIGVFLAKVSSFRFIRGFMYQWSKPFGRLRDRGSFFALGFCCSCVASQAQWRLESSQHSRHPVYGWLWRFKPPRNHEMTMSPLPQVRVVAIS